MLFQQDLDLGTLVDENAKQTSSDIEKRLDSMEMKIDSLLKHHESVSASVDRLSCSVLARHTSN